jgi:hypothetical protein
MGGGRDGEHQQIVVPAGGEPERVAGVDPLRPARFEIDLGVLEAIERKEEGWPRLIGWLLPHTHSSNPETSLEGS